MDPEIAYFQQSLCATTPWSILDAFMAYNMASTLWWNLVRPKVSSTTLCCSYNG